ncbi:MAG: hypothetical protein PUF10_10500 [Bacteroidales bacterium]|nr:hypothetical protein [Bacteroidales bacterium]
MYYKFISRIIVFTFLSVAFCSCSDFFDDDYNDDDTSVDYTLGNYHPAKKIHQIIAYSDYPSEIYREIWTWDGDNLQKISVYLSCDNHSPYREDYVFTYDSYGRISSVVENDYGWSDTIRETGTVKYNYYPNKVVCTFNNEVSAVYRFYEDGHVREEDENQHGMDIYYGAEYYQTSYTSVNNPIRDLLPEYNPLGLYQEYFRYALCFCDKMLDDNGWFDVDADDDNYPIYVHKSGYSSFYGLLYQISYY